MASIYHAFSLSLFFFVLTHLPLLTCSHPNETEEEERLSNCTSYSSSYQCGDINIPLLSYPFTNKTQSLDCGGLQLDCHKDNITKVSMHQIHEYGDVIVELQVVSISQESKTIVLNSTDPQRCNYFPLSTAAFSFTILDGPAHFRCLNSIPNFPNQEPDPTCGGDDFYYNPDPAKFSNNSQVQRECSILPVTEITLQYKLNDDCQKCVDRRGWCSDTLADFCTVKKNGKKVVEIIIGTTTGAIVLLAIIILIVFWRRRRIKQDSFIIDSTRPAQPDLETGTQYHGVRVFSYDELKEATDNFDATKELGEGGFGTVYHGKLRDGTEVAVKRLFEKNYKQLEQFKNEIKILTGLRHDNLVTLYGCTSRHSRQLLLVYDYIPNGTLADHLHGHLSQTKSLTWPIRLNIAIQTANALSYLHATDIIHRDVKTNNILLDQHFNVKVADFGLCRLFPIDVTHISTAPQGTPGYVDPEYHQCYHLTTKSDVYSFGVVLVELISSLPAVDIDRHRHEINLSTYAMNRIQCSAFHELVDKTLGFDTDFRVKRMTMLVAELAFQCLQHEREIRPSMEEVLETLKRIQNADYDDDDEEEESGRRKRSEVDKVMRATTSSSSIKQQPPSPSENDDIGLLTSVNHHPPPSPDSVINDWTSKSTTPNTSAEHFST